MPVSAKPCSLCELQLSTMWRRYGSAPRSAPRRSQLRSGSARPCAKKGSGRKSLRPPTSSRWSGDWADRRWRSVRGDSGWLTTYWYSPGDIAAEKLAQVWSARADGIVQNITLFGDGSATATVTVRTAQQPTAPLNLMLRTLRGEQAQAIAANLCGPLPVLRGIGRGALQSPLLVPIGPSGVLLGKVAGGNRMLLPLDD